MNGLQHTSTDSVFALTSSHSSGSADTANASQKTEHSRERVSSEPNADAQTTAPDVLAEKQAFRNLLKNLSIDQLEEIDITANSKISIQEVPLPDNLPTDFISSLFEQAITPNSLKAELANPQIETKPVDVKNAIPASIAPVEKLSSSPITAPIVSPVNILQSQVISSETGIAPASTAPIRGELAINALTTPLIATLVHSENNPRLHTTDVKGDSQNQLQASQFLATANLAGTHTETGDGQQNQNSDQTNRKPPHPLTNALPTRDGTATVAFNLTPDTSHSFIARAPEIGALTTPTLQPPTTALPTQFQTSHVAVQQVGNALILQAEKSGDIVVRLDPAELGRVNINFTFDKGTGGVNAHVVADTATTTAILRDRADLLSLQLKQAGFENVNLSFDTTREEQNQKDFGNQFAERQQSEQAANQHGPFFDIVPQDNTLARDASRTLPTRGMVEDGAIDMKL